MYYIEKILKWGPSNDRLMDSINWLKTPRSGVLFAVASSFLISVCSVLVKVTTVPIGQIIFTTYSFLFLISVILTLNTKETLFPKSELKKLWGSALFFLPITISSYKAVRLLPLSDEALIAYTSIIFTIILGRIFLHESCTKGKLVASSGIFIGVCLITVGPAPLESSYLIGCIFALIGAVCDATSFIVFKGLTYIYYSVILLNYSLCGIILTLPLCLMENWTWEPIPLITLAALASLHEILITLSLSTEQAGLVCMLHASDVIFSYGFELSLFDETYTIVKICGAIIVTVSVLFSAYLPNDDGAAASEEDEKTDLCSADEFI